MPSALSLYRRLADKPMGQWLFSRLICFKAPYFATIRPRITALEPALAPLTLEHRAIPLLRDIEDLSYDDIAQVLGISLGTVKSRIARARAGLLHHMPH